MALVLLIVLFFTVVCPSLSNHVDESIALPMAVLSPDETEVVTFNVDANGNATTLQLNCSGVGTLNWYRGTPPVRLDNSFVTLLDNNLLMLTISPVVNNTDANGSGIPYFCVANNTLGRARSRTVLVKYAFFDGFEAENTTTEVTVRLGQAVAIECGVIGAAPPPEYVWYTDNQTVINTVDTPLKIRTLDDGATLVIYDLTADDVSKLYTCGVTNARMFDTEISTRMFKFTETVNFDTTFKSYRPPRNVTVTSTKLQQTITFYYIGATNAASTRLFSPVDFDNSDSIDTLGASIDEVPNEDPFLSLIAGNNVLSESESFFTLTVIEPLVVQERPSNISTIFHRFTNESINFTCTATGTGTQLQWYHNAEKRTVSSPTLVFDNLSVDDAGVYQCFWEESDDGTFALDTWALAVQVPVPPFGFTITPSHPSPPTNPNRTIVPTGDVVSLTMEFVADEVESIVWFRSGTDSGDFTEIQFASSTLYNTTGAEETNMKDVFRVIFTILSVNNVTSGYYYAIIDDGRTAPVRTPTWFVSEQVEIDVLSLTLSPHGCLLEGVTNQIQCVVNGLPDPTVMFDRSSNLVVCPVNGSCEIKAEVESTVTTATLTFFDVSESNEGVYECSASNTVTSDEEVLVVEYSTSNTLAYCTSPEILSATEDKSILEGEDITLRCRISSIPTPTALWYKNGELVEEVDGRVDIRSIDEDGYFDLTLTGVFENDTANYTCFFNNTRIPAEVSESIYLTVTVEEITAAKSSSDSDILPIVIGAAGGVAVLICVVIVVVILLCCCLIHSNKSKKGSYTTGVQMQDYTDGRGNVDKDSDEEDNAEHHEAFQPQYESLPAIRPAQPPEYKPSPAYNNQFSDQDFDMMKPPIPDDGQTPLHYHPQQFFTGDNGGMAIHGSMMQGLQTHIPMGSSMGLQQQPRFDDFASDDEKFV